MKKFILIFFTIVISLFFITGYYTTLKNRELEKKYAGFKIVVYQVQSRNYKLLVADTPEKWNNGLMNFKNLDGVDGMLFLMSKKLVYSFWNKDTYLDLDVLWLDGDRVIGKSYLPAINKGKEVVVSAPAPADKVIEIVR